MNIQQISNVVDRLNSDLYHLCPYDDQFIGLSILSNGYEHTVSFIGLHVWDSENYCWPDELAETEENFENIIRMQLRNLFTAMLPLVSCF